MRQLWLQLLAGKYRWLARPLLFRFGSETVHTGCTRFGERLGRSALVRQTIGAMLKVEYPSLSTTLAGITFANPVGLAAGFDYEARLTGLLPALGFGWHTIGTVTRHSYLGNPRPQLGRLVKSRSLLVNKGLRNEGAPAILHKLARLKLNIPTGLSLGKTNKSEVMSLSGAITDVVESFQLAEQAPTNLAYYELNISCPNLPDHSLSFYLPHNLRQLLAAVTGLKLRRPLFIKMPISEPDDQIRAMLQAIVEFPVAAVIFGNLQKNRHHPTLLPREVAACGPGNFSGRPTQERSDELVGLAYREYGQRLKIIGCGGIFSAADAYRKIRLGASLVQLITGLVFVGPQLVAQINWGLDRLLRADGFTNIAQAVGAAHRNQTT